MHVFETPPDFKTTKEKKQMLGGEHNISLRHIFMTVNLYESNYIQYPSLTLTSTYFIQFLLPWNMSQLQFAAMLVNNLVSTRAIISASACPRHVWHAIRC